MDLRDEFAEIVADLRAWVEVERLHGARLFPKEQAGEALEPAASELSMPTPNRQMPSRRDGRNRPRNQVRVSAPHSGKSPSTKPVDQGPGKWGRILKRNEAKVGVQNAPMTKPQGAERLQAKEQLRESMGEGQPPDPSPVRSSAAHREGPQQARLMVIGEALGHREDAQSVPLMDEAGQMLDKMFRHVLGVEREDVFIADVVNRVPSNGGRPSLDEIERSLPFLKEQILKCQPELVLVMGNVACQALFGPQANVSRIRGKWQEIDMAEGSIRVLPTFHPKYLLQNPDDKRLCFADLKEMRMALDQADG